MCSSMRCYLWSVRASERKYAGHLFKFFRTFYKNIPFLKSTTTLSDKVGSPVFDKILPSTLIKNNLKNYVIRSNDFLHKILDSIT